MIDFLGTYLPEFFYVLCGLVSFDTAYRATKNKEARIGTSLFWFLLGVIFMFGKIIPPVGVGVLLILMGCLTALKQVKMEIAAEYEMYPEDVFDLIELGYNKENSKLRVKRSKERTSFSKTGHLE